MSNSSLVDYIELSPNCSSRCGAKIDKITIHHVAGVASVEGLGNVFAPWERQASANYGVGSDGRIGLYVDEEFRAWTSGSYENDSRAVTIEVSNSAIGEPWPVSDYVLSRLIDLCVDICRRNGIERINYTGDATGNLTMHRWFQPTGCPGEYLASKFPYIAEKINEKLEEGKPMTKEEKQEFESLKALVEKISADTERMLLSLDVLEDTVGAKWERVESLPEWAAPTVEKLVDAGYLKGSGNGFELSYLLLRVLVILDRAGAFEK